MDEYSRQLLSEIKSVFPTNKLFAQDFLQTWDKSLDELKTVVLTAELLQHLYGQGKSLKVWDGGLAVANFRDKVGARQSFFYIPSQREQGFLLRVQLIYWDCARRSLMSKNLRFHMAKLLEKLLLCFLFVRKCLASETTYLLAKGTPTKKK